jgi:large subunit ribosomal protein L21
MFAVIKTGGKQYRVAADETITIMSLAGEPGESVTFGEVLMLTGDDSTQLGAPFVEGASVAGTIVEHKRGPKVIAFKKRRRKNSKRKRGHRQDLTVIKITGIEGGGKSAAKAKGAE